MTNSIVLLRWAPPRPEVYRFDFSGAQTTGIFTSRQLKEAIPYGIAPSKTSRRSGRTSALPYPPDW